MLYRVRKGYNAPYKDKWVPGGEVLDLTEEEYKGIAHLMENVPQEAPSIKTEEELVHAEDVVMGTETNRAIITPRGRRKVGK